MTSCGLSILLGLLIVIWAVLSRRAEKMERQITLLRSELRSSGASELQKRVAALEKMVASKEWKPAAETTATAEPKPAPLPVAAPIPAPEPPTPEPPKPPPLVVEKPKPLPLHIPQKTTPPRPAPAPSTRLRVETPPPVPTTPKLPTVPHGPTLIEKLRERMKGEEWELIIGGSWLNKVGVLVLIIGLVLILNYSLIHLGPAGKIVIGIAVSLVLLIGGVMLGRKERYQIFARGVIGGGWAGLYFTTFAMHGIEASRIIDSPTLGTVLLLAVAVAMIAHSLQYRSEVVTGLAYFTGFLALAISPANTFAAVAAALLAGSLLVISWRLSWNNAVVAGLVATYGIYVLHHPASTSGPALVTSQAFLLIYWALFEIYDLFSISKRQDAVGIARTIFPLNAAGFIGVSLLQWSTADLGRLDTFFGLAAAAYLLSTLIRARIRPADSFPEEMPPLHRAILEATKLR